MLPKIEYPKTEVSLLVTGKKVSMRPMTIREEKILLMAQESADRQEILKAVVQILEACVDAGNVKIQDMPSYNIEWLFIKLRAISVSNALKMSLNYAEKDYPFQVDLDKIEPKMPEGRPPNNIIDIDDKTKITIRHTPIKAVLNDVPAEDILTSIIVHSIAGIEYDGQTSQNPDSFGGDMKEWVENLPSHVLEKVEEYLNHIPTITHVQEVHVGTENPETVRFENIYDFFML